MNIRFRNLTLILLATTLFNCSKESEDINTIKEKYYKTIITLSKEQKIKKVDFYEADTLRYSQFTNYKYELVEILQTDNNENIKTKSSYFLDSIGLAHTCIDSSYYNSKLSNVIVTNFKYDNDYKVESKITITDFYNSSEPSISTMELIYEYVDGNMVSINIGGDCSDYYEYTSLDNKIDIISFLGDFCGKSDSKLRKSYNSGCHYAPSTAPPSSTYDYKLNSDGFVIQKVENYTSSYHVTNSKPTKEKRITNFEYKNE